MALLNLSVVLEDYVAAPGNNLSVAVAISVTSAAGVPVAGLALADFTVGSHFFPTGGVASALITSAPGPLAGTYSLRLQPTGGGVWVGGVYIFDIRVINGADQGTIVTSVLLD